MNKARVAVVIATWFGSGLMCPRFFGKLRSGTYGSIAAIPLCLLAIWVSASLPSLGPFGRWEYYGAIVFAFLYLGSWSVPFAERRLGPRTDWRGKTKTRDQNEIVVDEVAGMLIACMPLIGKKGWLFSLGIIAALVLFRFFDIVKVWPTTYFDRQKSAEGVMLDDVVAGVQAVLVLLGLRYLLSS